MRSQIEDRVCDELAWTVERCLSAAHGFDELGTAICPQKLLLFFRDSPYFSTATGVCGREFGGYDIGRWSGEGLRWFGGEEAGDEVFLELGGYAVGDYAWEVEVDERPHWAGLGVCLFGNHGVREGWRISG